MNNLKKISLPSFEKVIIYLIVIYVVGVMGMLVDSTRSLFLFLVPFNILGALMVMLGYHQKWSKAFITSIVCIYLGGFGVEWLGVHTGYPFGQYQYGQGLGFSLWDVPLIMGINWLLLVYGVSVIASRITHFKPLIAVIGAILMLVYDILLEPSAMRYQFWNWGENEVPIQNYLGWVISAFVFIYFFVMANKNIAKNPIAEAIFWLQLLFFGILYLANY